MAKKGKDVSIEMMLKATSLARGKSESNETFLARVTHLHLQSKRILNVSKVDVCTNLKVLYLYDNMIDDIPSLEFAKKLAYLYLQNNNIHHMPELVIPNLKKIYLDENKIDFLTGLQNCALLEELFIARQRLPRYTPLEFDIASLQAVADTLQVIDVSGNQIESILPLQTLYNLRRVLAQDNNISNVGDIEAVVSLSKIEEANFINNPCCHRPRYRDCAVAAASDRLKLLDDVEVLKHQQIAIRGLQAHRRKIGAMFPEPIDNGYYNEEDDAVGMDGVGGSIFGEDVDGEAIQVQYSEADDVAFGARPEGDTNLYSDAPPGGTGDGGLDGGAAVEIPVVGTVDAVQ